MFDALRVPHELVAELAKRAPLDVLPDFEGAALETAMIDEAGNFRAIKLLQNRINARVRLEARLEISEQPDSVFGTPARKSSVSGDAGSSAAICQSPMLRGSGCGGGGGAVPIRSPHVRHKTSSGSTA